jgi:hypothetical protein
VGPARIGRVTFSKTARSVHYDGRSFQTLAGRGFKANYVDVESGEQYWVEIRGLPDRRDVSQFRARAKH